MLLLAPIACYDRSMPAVEGEAAASRVARHTAVACDQLLEILRVIADSIMASAAALPADVRAAVEARFAECWGMVASLRQSAETSDRPIAPTGIADPLRETRHVLMAQEGALAERQLRFRLHASAVLPHVAMAPEALRFVMSEIVARATQCAAKRTLMAIALREVPLRQGSGVSLAVIVRCPGFTEQDRYRLFEELSGQDGDDSPLAHCHRMATAVAGQIWVELPERGSVAFVVVVPCVQGIGAPDVPRWKFDVVITNYPEIATTYGVQKGAALLEQLAGAVRAALRSPTDVVAAFDGRGVVSALIEAPPAARAVIAARVQAAVEGTRCMAGRKPVTPVCEYRVADLP